MALGLALRSREIFFGLGRGQLCQELSKARRDLPRGRRGFPGPSLHPNRRAVPAATTGTAVRPSWRDPRREVALCSLYIARPEDSRDFRSSHERKREKVL